MPNANTDGFVTLTYNSGYNQYSIINASAARHNTYIHTILWQRIFETFSP